MNKHDNMVTLIQSHYSTIKSTLYLTNRKHYTIFIANMFGRDTTSLSKNDIFIANQKRTKEKLVN